MKTKAELPRTHVAILRRSLFPKPGSSSAKLNAIHGGGYTTPTKPAIQLIAGSWTK